MFLTVRSTHLLAVFGALIAFALSGAAWAQEGQSDRFFADKAADDEGDDDDKKSEDTLVQGSLTSTTFAYTESGQAVQQGGVTVDSASPVNRLFTDMRAQLYARHISGGSFDFRLDARARASNSCQFNSVLGNGGTGRPDLYDDLQCRVQSGTFGDTEYEAREVYVKRTGDKLDVYLGRQYVLDLAATKIDGVRGVYRSSKQWSWIGFAGLYPSRTSRSVFDDYPVQQFVDGMGAQQEQRVMPIAVGGGGAYRFQQMYGSLGAVGILPRAQRVQLLNGIPQALGEEPLRAFVTATGYWRQSTSLDVYHFGVLDFQGSSQGLTNLSVGANYRPSQTMRISAAVNQVDTETLDVIAQDRLENPDNQGGLVQNNVEVTRIASRSARVGVSVALNERRFEVSVSGQVRERPDINVNVGDVNGTNQLIPGERAAEVIFQVVDRRSYKGWRLGGTFLNTLPVGDDNAFRSQTRYVRVFGSKEVRDGRGQFDADVSYLSSADDGGGVACNLLDIETCFGTSDVQTIGVSGTLVYRLKADWLFAGNASAARQTISTDQLIVTPTNTLLSAFVRLAYRF